MSKKTTGTPTQTAMTAPHAMARMGDGFDGTTHLDILTSEEAFLADRLGEVLAEHPDGDLAIVSQMCARQARGHAAREQVALDSVAVAKNALQPDEHMSHGDGPERDTVYHRVFGAAKLERRVRAG